MPHSIEVTIDTLKRLVAFRSVSDQPSLPIMRYIADRAEAVGALVRLFETECGEKAELVATLGSHSVDEEKQSRGLILSGHVDVVPADEPDWTSDPFTLTKRGDHLFGRGACDMKGAVAVYMSMIDRFGGCELDAPLVIMLTSDEEVGSLGARRLVEAWPRDLPLPQHAIIGEPTSLRAVRMHKGHLKLRIIASGQAAHSGTPELGLSAIEPVGEILCGLNELAAELRSSVHPEAEHFPQAPYPSLNIGVLRGGSAINIVPDQCEIELGVRLLPGMRGQPIVERIVEIINSIETESTIQVEPINDNPPLLSSADGALYRAICELVDQRDTVGVSFASDGGVLHSELGIEPVLFGPGSMAVAHKANEFVPIDELAAYADHIAALVNRFCVTAPPTSAERA